MTDVPASARGSNNVCSYGSIEGQTHMVGNSECSTSSTVLPRMLAIQIDRKLNSTDLIEALSDVFIPRGMPGHVRSDNVLRAEGNRESSQSLSETPACSRSMTFVKLQGRTRRLPRVKEKISSIANTGYADCGPHRPQHELLIQAEDPHIIYKVCGRCTRVVNRH
jgi:hypothetical protein